MDKPKDPPKPIEQQKPGYTVNIGRNQAKIHLLHSLSSPTAIPIMFIWFDEQAGGWSFVYDNDLKNQKVPRKATARLLFDLIADLKLFEEISVKAD